MPVQTIDTRISVQHTAAADTAKKLIVLHKGEVLVRQLETLDFPLMDNPNAYAAAIFVAEYHNALHYAIALDDEAAFEQIQTQTGTQRQAIRAIPAAGEGLFALVSRAKQLFQWYASHRFCGCCGAPTSTSETEHMVFCRRCDHRAYPRINPCIIVLITHGDKILLAKHSNRSHSFYTCLAGFVEAGESLEQCLHREVYEEVAVRVGNLSYFDSQPWPFPSQLMMGFWAEYESGEIQEEVGEIHHADWFDVRELPEIPISTTIAGRMIRSYVASRR